MLYCFTLQKDAAEILKHAIRTLHTLKRRSDNLEAYGIQRRVFLLARAFEIQLFFVVFQVRI